MVKATTAGHAFPRRERNNSGNGRSSCMRTIERYTSLRVCFFAVIVAIHIYLLRIESIVYRELRTGDENIEEDSIVAKALRDGITSPAARQHYDDYRSEELSIPVSRNGFLSRGSLRTPFIFQPQPTSNGDLTFDQHDLDLELAKHQNNQQHNHRQETKGEISERTKVRILPRTIFLNEKIIVTSQSTSENNLSSKTPKTMDLEEAPKNKQGLDIEETSLLDFERPFYNDCEQILSPMPTVHPTCNKIHELSLITSDVDSTLLSMKGSWRSVWKVNLDNPSGKRGLSKIKDVERNETEQFFPSNTTIDMYEKKRQSSVVLKMLHLHRQFDHKSFAAHSTDIIVMDRLTASPYVVDAFAFCGQSVITEFAASTGRDYVKRYEVGSRERMRIARDLARGLSDVQALQPMPHDEIVANRNETGEYDNTPSIPVVFAHNDINIANTVMVNDRIKWNDFNIGLFMRKRKREPDNRFGSSKERHHRPPSGRTNIETVTEKIYGQRDSSSLTSATAFAAFTEDNMDKTTQLCPAPVLYRSDMWRSPEEIKNSSYVQMTQTDVYGIANILYQIMTRHQPWTYKEPGGALTKTDVANRKLEGGMPTIPEQYLNTTKRELQALFAATNMCFFPSPKKRPTARRLAYGLGTLYEKIKRKERVTRRLILDFLLPPNE